MVSLGTLAQRHRPMGNGGRPLRNISKVALCLPSPLQHRSSAANNDREQRTSVGSLDPVGGDDGDGVDIEFWAKRAKEEKLPFQAYAFPNRTDIIFPKPELRFSLKSATSVTRHHHK